uniref:Reverse transcriptase domain-containing protein n=1 Tax=Oryzias latipes TaxID=8090 RepID=A0A3B3HTW8_ORYLA
MLLLHLLLQEPGAVGGIPETGVLPVGALLFLGLALHEGKVDVSPFWVWLGSNVKSLGSECGGGHRGDCVGGSHGNRGLCVGLLVLVGAGLGQRGHLCFDLRRSAHHCVVLPFPPLLRWIRWWWRKWSHPSRHLGIYQHSRHCRVIRAHGDTLLLLGEWSVLNRQRRVHNIGILSIQTHINIIIFHSNKSGKYLANQLKINKEKTTISSVIDLTGNATHDPAAINSVFKNFYQSLYSSQINPSDNDINSFLNSIDLPRPTEEQITALESPFTKEELHKALTNMPSKKAPGPDGFPAEFYKEFWQILAPIFLRMTIEIKDNNYLPPNMNSANIILLLKPGKDPTSPSSYRPISLINADLKIICKALAGRLEKVVPSLIHPDQTGFIKGRHSSTNMRRLINLIDYTTTNNREATILSLDAEKAFDRVNWKFLIATLNKFGFGKSFINWIKILYASPNARIRTNDQTSPSFNLQRGTRQGCPLSPSLFALFIEPLAAAIRQSRDIEGIQTKNLEHKISLYADDVLLFTPNSQSSICQIISLINRFSSVSEYSINWSKSTILPINCNYLNPSSMKIQTGNIKYLGINISSRLSDLLKLNHTQLLKTSEADLTRWKTLPISLIGRVATIKMTILPKINYLFSMIPSKPPTTWFKSLDSFISQYLWEGKPPRISLKTIKKPKDRGGLGLPDFQDYYSANRLCYVQKWLNPGVLDESWLDTEQNLCDNLNISNLPFFSSKIKQHKCFRSLNISSSLTAWWDFLKKNNLTLFPCKLTPIWNNPDILINKNMIHFASWKNKGIQQFQHIIQNRKFMSLSTLSSTYGININKFLEYQQLKSASSFSFGFSHQGSPQRIILFHLTLSWTSSTLTLANFMSSVKTSMYLLFGRPLALLPGSSISNILLPIYPLSLL